MIAAAHHWRAEIAKFLSLETLSSQQDMDPDDPYPDLFLSPESDWELANVNFIKNKYKNKNDNNNDKVWPHYFTPDSSFWFSQEAGEALKLYQ